ncbi:hypothetical protein [Persicobacter psychrovividus]|uniref:Lipoprotein n=1 Tax=Persicobacter psychrovividus TaxID=387638 RepID=A0ABN6L487_9BACT|nr:hypothetical protein PEPS_01900 [Persicobacter psychrovividus]
MRYIGILFLLLCMACEPKEAKINFSRLDQDLSAIKNSGLDTASLNSLRAVNNPKIQQKLAQLTYADFCAERKAYLRLKAERNTLNTCIDSLTLQFNINKKKRFEQLTALDIQPPYLTGKTIVIPYQITFHQDSLMQYFPMLELRYYSEDRQFVHSLFRFDSVNFDHQYKGCWKVYASNAAEASQSLKTYSKQIAEQDYRLDFRPSGPRKKVRAYNQFLEQEHQALFYRRSVIDAQLFDNRYAQAL